ncbi:SGNH hydrolase [Aspergillus sclerotiicarbonarius CBS 121057]|uniref:SGNH hydrolase n=1 Tax=Aspergillus sclerotiicarbonarius (strain CBS 121057 / IBT 28362) TaxID=1448318 RepID=A0A319EKL8_ASPSB|nr:SGNH hydrolase [Aspergillus sclerotiicarbonarius CBS 121057]
MILLILLLVNLITGHGLNPDNYSTPQASHDPQDFTWIERWAAIGDSYTAGIGSGDLWTDKEADYKCSRYDLSYPALLKHAFGAQVGLFEYRACSGDRTADIFKQAKRLYTMQDVVVLTAGGNDLCLADIIKTCIFLPFQGEQKCQEVIDQAQHNIDTILKPNVREILDTVQTKMNYNGIIIYVLYGQFFNTENDDCTDNQDWAFPRLDPINPLPLTRERREKFNKLVANINNAIKDVIHDLRPHEDRRPYIRTADWDAFMKDGLQGQYCVPWSSGLYPDPKQPYLHFFKPDTTTSGHRELKKRGLVNSTSLPDESMSSLYNSTLYHSPNPSAAALHDLNPRDPAPPGCPGDSGVSLGMGLPDRWGKYFHPNEMGHRTIASFVLDAIITERALILGKSNPTCQRSRDEFRCWQKDGRRDYANAELLYQNYKTYCAEVKRPKNRRNWKDERWFNTNTPDTHYFSITLSNDATHYDQAHCMESFERIITSCDGNDPENPMNWKFGGRWTRGSYTYELNIQSSFKRPWPPTKKVGGSCDGTYKGLFSRYYMRGRGWSTWDSGQDTLVPAIRDCIGLGGLTGFEFNYLDQPDKDGNEWKATFKTPIWTNPRCFNNNKVAFAAGGFTNGCTGSG